MRSNSIEVKPIAGALGAELHGIDLGNMSDDDFADMHDAFLAHQVVFFREQKLTPVQQIGVAKRFGEIHLHPYMQGLPDHPEVLEIVKREEDTKNFGGGWHTDQAFSPRPALCTLLYAKELPIFGGDTMFTNMYAAYEALSQTMKDVLAPLKGLFLGDRSAAAGGPSRKEKYTGGAMKPKDPNANEGTQAEHPLVRTHPDTGRKSLFLSSHTAKHRRHDGRGKRVDPVLPATACSPPRIHLPLPLGARFVRDLGRPLHAAFCDQRLQRPAPGDAPDHGAG